MQSKSTYFYWDSFSLLCWSLRLSTYYEDNNLNSEMQQIGQITEHGGGYVISWQNWSRTSSHWTVLSEVLTNDLRFPLKSPVRVKVSHRERDGAKRHKNKLIHFRSMHCRVELLFVCKITRWTAPTNPESEKDVIKHRRRKNGQQRAEKNYRPLQKR